MDEEEFVAVRLTYSEIKAFDDRLGRNEQALVAIKEGIDRLLQRDTEVIELRAKVTELEIAIAGAVDRTDTIEAGARAGLPAQ